MKGQILITDSLFVFPEHESILRSEGYEIIRLDKPDASEQELIKAVEGKVGYILGGIEKVTENVINAADTLRAIVFTGADWRQFIPGHAVAHQCSSTRSMNRAYSSGSFRMRSNIFTACSMYLSK